MRKPITAHTPGVVASAKEKKMIATRRGDACRAHQEWEQAMDDVFSEAESACDSLET